MKQHLSNVEQETILTINSDTKHWHICTTRSQDFNKYRDAIDNPVITKYDDGSIMCVEGDLKENWYLPKFREHRKLTEEQSQKFIERMKASKQTQF